MMTTTTQHPIETIRDGRLSASIWQNTGEKGIFYSVTFGRTYTDENEQPKTANGFSGSDLLRIAHLATQAYDRCNQLREANK